MCIRDSPKFVDWVKSTEKLDHTKMLKDNMRPFEDIFFGVGAEILDNASNYLSSNPQKTSEKLVNDLNNAVKALKAKKDFSNIGKLTAQLKKLKSMKRNAIIINTARGGIINEIDLDIALKSNLVSDL